MFADILDDATTVSSLAAEVSTTYGKQRSLFPAALFRSAMDNWPYRKFAILAAIYASVGRYDYRIVTREKILAGAVGFSNNKERQAAGSVFEVLSVNKLRTTIDHLVDCRLIARAPNNRRTTAYARVKPQVDIAKRVTRRNAARSKAKDDSFWQQAAGADAEATTTVTTSSPVETADERHNRIARESLARQAASERRYLQLYPPRPTKPTPRPAAVPTSTIATVPKAPPTEDELEKRRQQIARLTGGN